MDQDSTTDHALVPWAEAADEAAPRRHDAFAGKRRRAFLDALAKTGCVRDAARAAGVTPATVYNHQARDAAFAHHCRIAIDMAGTDIELHAWERGVVGIEEEVLAYGKVVGTRIKRSDMILKLLLQGCKPNKYGPRAGFTRKRLTAAFRREIEREVREEWRQIDKRAAAEGIEKLTQQLVRLGARRDQERREAGWVQYNGVTWIPPGWSWTGDGEPFVPPEPDIGNLPESM